jgi:hypothetical protein
MVVAADDDDALPLRAAAREAGISESTLRRAIADGLVAASSEGGVLRVTRQTVIELRTRGGALRRGPGPSVVAAEEREGERDARVFAALEAGRTVAEIIVAERIPARVVLALRQSWLDAHRADREGVAYACGCGAPSDPSTARCIRCFERMRVLTGAQAALLAGAELPPPGTCTCRGCGTRARIEDVDALCVRCAEKLTIAERGGVLVVVLAGTVVRELSIAETRAVVGQLAHHLLPKGATS